MRFIASNFHDGQGSVDMYISYSFSIFYQIYSLSSHSELFAFCPFNWCLSKQLSFFFFFKEAQHHLDLDFTAVRSSRFKILSPSHISMSIISTSA